jgi:hypothetical protein
VWHAGSYPFKTEKKKTEKREIGKIESGPTQPGVCDTRVDVFKTDGSEPVAAAREGWTPPAGAIVRMLLD